MAQIIRVKPGVTVNQDGTYPEMRGGRTGELLKSDAHARYQEAAYRGNVFSAVFPAAVAIVAATTATNPWTLSNPPNSGKLLSLLEVTWAITTLNAAAQTTAITWSLAAYSNNLFSGITKTSVVNALVGSNIQPVGIASTIATCVSATPTVIRYLGGEYQDVASAATSLIGWAKDEVAGAVIIAPNSGITVQCNANGGTIGNVSILVGMTWEEIPL